MMEYIFLFFFLNFGFYSVFLIINIISLTLYSSNKFSKISTIPVSVIVAIRNGEKSLNNLIENLLSQDYKGQVELIFVDDQSNDNTEAIIKKAQNSHPSIIRYISSDEESADFKFKKRALSAGIKKSKFDVLLFTDVDCQIKKSWISSIAKCFEGDVDYVIGFSRAKYKFGMANLFQRIDYLMMMFSAKAFTNIRFPLASSGQNQAFRKSLFEKVGGYKKISNLLMGDDSIFLQLCLKHKANVVFCDNPDSYVFCRSEKNWKDLLFQKMRWAGDGKIMWRYNYMFYQIMISAVLSNLLIIILLFSGSINALAIVVSLKFILELIICILGTIQFKEKISFYNFIYWYILAIPYVCTMCFASFFVPFISWKQRGQ